MQTGRRPVDILNVCEFFESVWIETPNTSSAYRRVSGAESQELRRESCRWISTRILPTTTKFKYKLQLDS